MVIATPSRDDLRCWLASLRFSHFVSLAYNAGLSGKQAVGTIRTDSGITVAAPSRRVVTSSSVTMPRIYHDLRALDARVQRHLSHAHWQKLPFDRRIFWVATVESLRDNPHLHLHFRVPFQHALPFAKLWGNVGPGDVWRDIAGSGDSHVRLVNDEHRAGGYAVKQMPDLDRDEGLLILANQFWPSGCKPAFAAEAGTAQP